MKNPSSARPRQTTQITPQFPQRLSHMTSVSVSCFPALPVSPRSVCQTRLELTTREGSLRNKRVEMLLFKMWWSAPQRPTRQGFIFALQKHKRTEVFSHFEGITLEPMLPGSSVRASLWICVIVFATGLLTIFTESKEEPVPTTRADGATSWELLAIRLAQQNFANIASTCTLEVEVIYHDIVLHETAQFVF